jgi:hypothetical protein
MGIQFTRGSGLWQAAVQQKASANKPNKDRNLMLYGRAHAAGANAYIVI